MPGGPGRSNSPQKRDPDFSRRSAEYSAPEYAQHPSMGQEDKRIFYAIIFCGAAIFCLAVPALIVGAIALAQSAQHSNNMMYPMGIAGTPAPSPNSNPGSTTAPAPSTTPTPPPSSGQDTPAHTPAPEAKPHYTYDGGANGPAHWGEITTDWSTCSTGTFQSPIDLKQVDAKPSGPDITGLTMANFQDVGAYIPDDNTFKNQALVSFNGHAITTNSPLASYFIHSGTWYQLQQFHFHTPSEHRFEGQYSDAEIHLVHATLNNKLLVIGIMVDEGATTPPFAMDLFNSLARVSAASPGPEQFNLNVTQMLVDIGVPMSPTPVYQYAGSLTTPPCSEGVTWIVIKKKITMKAGHIMMLKNIMGKNSRPVQQLNGRTLFDAT